MTTTPDTMTATTEPLMRTDLRLPGRRQGKVRDIYEIPARGDEPARLLIIATDRVSAFDVVMPNGIPGKGCLLTDISLRWFEFIRQLGLIGDHLLSSDPADVPDLTDEERAMLEGRIMIGRKAKVVPVECVVRGYLAGSGWKEYQKRGSVCGVPLPEGLRNGDRLPEPIFTPTTKADTGHDEPLDFDEACEVAGRDVMEKLRAVSIALYGAGAAYAIQRGIILADTKFEFGWAVDDAGKPTDEVILIDEVLTPDSSRYWPADKHEPGREQDNFDKQYVRNYLQTIVDAGNWDKTPPGPELPDDVVSNTRARYAEARERLFGTGTSA